MEIAKETERKRRLGKGGAVMIRYADERDMEIVQLCDKYISKQELEQAVHSKRVLVMYQNDCFIGWLRYNLFWDEIPFMNMLFFLKSYRGRGNGTQLVAFWEKEMADSGYEMVLTSTLSNEQAQFFYRKNGYVDCGSLLLPGMPLEIIMRKGFT